MKKGIDFEPEGGQHSEAGGQIAVELLLQFLHDGRARVEAVDGQDGEKDGAEDFLPRPRLLQLLFGLRSQDAVAFVPDHGAADFKTV